MQPARSLGAGRPFFSIANTPVVAKKRAELISRSIFARRYELGRFGEALALLEAVRDEPHDSGRRGRVRRDGRRSARAVPLVARQPARAMSGLAAKVDEYRMSQGRTPTQEKLVGLAGETCPSDPRVIYAYYFETCAGSMKPMCTDWEAMCGCSTGKVVRGLPRQPQSEHAPYSL